jgi:hypothetical protein
MVITGVISTNEQSVPLSRIQDVGLTWNFVHGGYIVISSAGGLLGVESLGPLSRAKAIDFADAIGRALPDGDDGVARPAGPGRAMPPRLIADELRQLAELRDAGVLTEEEFTQQKARLLRHDERDF